MLANVKHASLRAYSVPRFNFYVLVYIVIYPVAKSLSKLILGALRYMCVVLAILPRLFKYKVVG